MIRWLPVALLALVILATGPLGPTVALFAYQGVAPAVVSARTLEGSRFVDLEGHGGPALGVHQERAQVMHPGGARA